MRKPGPPAAAAAWILAAAILRVGIPTSEAAAGPTAPPPQGSEYDVWFVIATDPTRRAEVAAAAGAELARTPRRHGVRFATPDLPPDSVPGSARRPVLALVEVSVEEGAPSARWVLAHGDGVVSPGWLVHAVHRGLEAVGREVRAGVRQPAWLRQLVARSSRRRPAGAADAALEQGIPAVGLRLAAPDPATAGRDLAAIARRLDGLEGFPVFEDEYLVVAGRVWLRRDLYWIGLGLWLPLFWRGRGRPGRLFRWLFLVSWWVAPTFAAVLLPLPAVTAAWAPEWAARRRAWALAPTVLFAALLVAELWLGARPVLSLVPVVLLGGALVAFVGRLDLATTAGAPANAGPGSPTAPA